MSMSSIEQHERRPPPSSPCSPLHSHSEKDSEDLQLAEPTTTTDRTQRDAHAHADPDPDDVFEGTLDPVYEAKARILNDAIQEIGMGRYQWHLFFIAGFGWFADNAWPIVTSLILAPVVNEFAFQGPFLTLGQCIGLLVGALFWGVGCDVWGRRISFNITLFITAVFGTAAGGAPDFVTLTALCTLWNVGVGGNLPVDSAVFLEFVPGSHQYLLTVLSIWWAVGQLIASLIAWPLIANFSCPQSTTSSSSSSSCPRSQNQGWRYFLFTMGALMFVLFALRFFVFELLESPKYLMGRGRDEDAVRAVWRVARYNGREGACRLGVEDLRAVGGVQNDKEKEGEGERERVELDTTARGAVRRKLAKFSMAHVKSLFATPKLALSTGLLIAIWSLIGLAFSLYNSFLPFYLATRGADFGDGSVFITYRNEVILSVIGIPGALLAGWAVELPGLGRKGTLCISTVLTGIFLFASTTARSSDALLGWNCGYSFTSNVMYGVLYALSPELFPTKDRGTGNGLTATGNRVFGILAPVIALVADLATSVPIWIAGALFVVAGCLALALPFDPRGKTSM